ncbi:integrase [Haloechinothrix salitolerans]|uniref:Tyrosine-type recombinase/integrase n=1 Tax=Haloechinothrix salitolerans TaxID=926830 RepID=A0ABW2BSK3_9PSEU
MHGYDVKIWKIQTRYKTNDKGQKVPARHIVRWSVDGERFEPSFRSFAQADSFRSELQTAARRGEQFNLETGLPISHAKKAHATPWYEFACSYADMKWDESSPKYRSGIADSLIAITLAMLKAGGDERPSTSVVSRALRRAFNKNLREQPMQDEQARALRWIARSTRDVEELAKLDVLRAVLAELDKKRNGERAARDTIRLRRIAFGNALDYAVEKELLDSNPMREIKTRKQKTTHRQVDRRSVVNPVQGRTLLLTVRETRPFLYAFFALLYYAGLRPEEAANIRKTNFSLPDEGWGEIHLEKASPEVGAAWTTNGERYEERELKHRAEDEGRTVPCSDELTAILHWHLEKFGTTRDGRLFWGERGGEQLGGTVYARAWRRTRKLTFTPEVVDSPLAKRPYDLRHAAVSTWLNATGDPVRVAEWAGHSVNVLLRDYAKCLDGEEQRARERLARRLKGR